MVKINASELVTDEILRPIMKVYLDIDMELWQDHSATHDLEETYSFLGRMLIAGIVDKKEDNQ